MVRLVRLNPPGKVSLAGAYAVGCTAVAATVRQDAAPGWYADIDPLEAVFLGAAQPADFEDGSLFANACHEWLRRLRGTAYWPGIERFVSVVHAASVELDLPVDDGDLMLLVARRLEAAGLDRPKLPGDLMPERVMSGARFLNGPATDLRLPDPPPDAAERVARLWTSIDVSLPNDGSAADALREGLHLLANAGYEVRARPTLLPALYLALVEDQGGPLSEAGYRALTWALGLDPASALVPVTDVLLIAAQRDLDADTVLGHLFAIPEFTEPAGAEDRRWHSSPGTALVRLALEMGHRQVVTRDGEVVRLSKGQAAAVEANRRAFEKKFGRRPGPEDPMLYDPEADEPRPVSVVALEDATVGLLEAAEIGPAWIYAFQQTGLLPGMDGSLGTDADTAEWNDCVDRYIALHQPGGQVDHEAETAKLRGLLVRGILSLVSDDPQYAASVVTQLTAGLGPDDTGLIFLRSVLRNREDDIIQELRGDRTVLAAACEYARAWAGAELADEVRAVADATAAGSSDGVLLAVVIAAMESS
jgi:hypothetical protein